MAIESFASVCSVIIAGASVSPLFFGKVSLNASFGKQNIFLH